MQTTNEKLDILIEKINTLIPEPTSDGFELKLIADELAALKTAILNGKTDFGQKVADKLFDLEALISVQPTIDIKPLRADIAELKTAVRLLSEKPEYNCHNDIESTANEPTPAFTKRMYRAVSIAFVVTMAISVMSYKFLLPAFPFALGLFVTIMGVGVWLFLDEYIFYTNSIGKLAKNAVGIGLATLAISILYFTGVTIGTSYFGNPYGGENENAVKVIKYENSGYNSTIKTESNSENGSSVTGTRRDGTQVLDVENSGKAESEQ
jgi:hypothetical protein